MATQSNPRTFAFQSVGTGAIPLLSTTLATDILACAPDTASSGYAGQSVQVADSSIYQVGDFVDLLPAVGSTTPKPEYQVPVTHIPDGTHIVIFNSAPHNAGDFVALWWPCSQIRVQTSLASPPAASLFLGTTSALDATGADAFDDLAVDVTFVTPIRFDNSDSPSNYWIISTSGTAKYKPSLWQN
jgi:hypothetical protein